MTAGGGDHRRGGDGDGAMKRRDRASDTAGEREEGPSTAETAASAVSVAFTLALLGFVAWHAWTVPAAESPQASVVATTPQPDGSLEATIALVNDRDVGVVSATVEVTCGSPPAAVTFENVPAGGRATATVVCPPGSGDPTATVRSWQEP